jgi:hypothetical protein
MTDEQKTLADFKTAIFDKIDNILDLRDETWDFLKSKHTVTESEARLQEISDHSKEVSKIGKALNAIKRDTPAQETSVNAVIADLDRLNGFVVEIQTLIAKDCDSKQREAESKKVDLIKNATFFFGIPGLFVTGVKNGIGNGHIDVNEAMLIGFAVSIPTVFHKSVHKLFSKAAKGVCSIPTGLRAVPASIGNDMRVVYVREIIKEKTNSAKVCFSTAAKSINDNASAGKRQTSALIKRVLGKHGPKP